MKNNGSYFSFRLCVLATLMMPLLALGRGGESSGDHPTLIDPAYLCVHVAGGILESAVMDGITDSVWFCRLGKSRIGAKTLMDAVQQDPIPKAAGAYLNPAQTASSAEEACRLEGAVPLQAKFAHSSRIVCHFEEDDSWIDAETLLEAAQGRPDPAMIGLFGPLTQGEPQVP